jgi:hypothetical protein
MRFRKLRIAWSVGCGIVCLLLIVLWVRSYYYFDTLGFSVGPRLHRTFDVLSVKSDLWFLWRETEFPFGMEFQSIPSRFDLELPETYAGFRIKRDPSQHLTVLAIPDWFAILVTATVAAIPWLPWSTRFSLRTLLIATTLVAVVLGLIVWLA